MGFSGSGKCQAGALASRSAVMRTSWSVHRRQAPPPGRGTSSGEAGAGGGAPTFVNHSETRRRVHRGVRHVDEDTSDGNHPHGSLCFAAGGLGGGASRDVSTTTGVDRRMPFPRFPLLPLTHTHSLSHTHTHTHTHTPGGGLGGAPRRGTSGASSRSAARGPGARQRDCQTWHT